MVVLPACEAWRGERTYVLDIDTIDIFVVLDLPRTTPQVEECIRSSLPC